MNLHRHALIIAVVERLQNAGSWTGKTHVQKALSLLADTTNFDLPFSRVLYKHGPYSFDVAAALQEMKSYAAVNFVVKRPFGESFSVGAGAEFVKQHALSIDEAHAVEKICKFVGQRGVMDLERIATAAWIRKREGLQDRQKVAERLHQLKPHVSVEQAIAADCELAPLLS
ncbi:MAG: hypothetical protein KDA89_12705 [Planctomycetaceae bacterium]|nr:hypothetical protein [Planctomycetaceae bacterium]